MRNQHHAASFPYCRSFCPRCRTVSGTGIASPSGMAFHTRATVSAFAISLVLPATILRTGTPIIYDPRLARTDWHCLCLTVLALCAAGGKRHHFARNTGRAHLVSRFD